MPGKNKNEFPTQLLHKKLSNSELDARDVDFVTNLVTGTLQHVITLDFIIEQSCDKKTKMAPSVRTALRLATYELKILEKRPDVVINEYVELTKMKASHAIGLVNAILHQVDKNSTYERLQTLNSDDMSSDDLANLYSLKKWTTSYLLENLGRETAIKFMKDSLLPAHVNKIGEVTADISSQEIAKSIASEMDGESKFLEVGAGRGTKSALLHHFKLEWDRYDALELSRKKCEVMKERASALGFDVDNIYCCDATEFSTDILYDGVFIDAPCSGLGTIRRHPEIRQRIEREAINNSALLGLKMLENLGRFVKCGGKLFYATCTITPEENMDTIEKFLQSKEGTDFRFLKIIREPILTENSDAHFCVMLTKKP